MKNLILTALVLILSVSSVVAQHDIKTNLFGLFFKNYGLGYEYIINDEISVGAYYNYTNFKKYTDPEALIEGWGVDQNGYSISGEFRYYINPDFGADKRYIGAYGRYSETNLHDLNYYIGQDKFLFDMTYNGFILGVITGQKIVMNSGLYIETLIGIGKYISTNTEFSDSNSEKYVVDNIGIEEYDYISKWDLRFQFAVGYRIGGY
ncbi:MAG: DUF3575 domain-containing protein [Bacteroidales bacterium]|nr:DUF3575 domain-containing protein [Bacteroidales bacterium]